MRKVILVLVLFALLANISLAANLGVYETGDTVTYSVVCLTDEGKKDTGCGTSDDDILDPDDTTAKAPTVALAEVSDANFPGLWRGSYLIPADPLKGTWSIFIELTNTNSTTAATVLNFQVLTDYFATQGDLTSGIVVLTSATETQINNIETDTAAQDTSTELRTLLTGSDTAISTLTTSSNIGINLDDVSGTLDAGEIGSNAITAAKIAADAIGASEAGFLSDSTAFAGGNIASILTDTAAYDSDAEYATAIWNAATNAYGGAGTYGQALEDTVADTNEIQVNQSSFITATGFSTHSAADVWTTGSRELSTPADYKADVSTLSTTSQLNANVSTILSDTNAILVDTNEIQVNQSNFVTNVYLTNGSLVNDIWDELQSGHTTNGTFGFYLDSQISAISAGALSSEQNATLYNVSTSVWGHNITGGSSESAAWYITTIKTIVEWIEQLI